MSCSEDKEMYKVCCMCRVVSLFINHYYVDVSVVVEKDSLAVTIKLTTLLLFQIYQTEGSLINCFALFCVVLASQADVLRGSSRIPAPQERVTNPLRTSAWEASVVLDQPPFPLRVIRARSVNQSQLQSNQFNNRFSCSIFRLRS